ncbi:hypothetical protein SDC9_110211 [bioreactor metagenome]|uniref:CN hydrolase domain-containing protein n=1 Tax=bioreactor metagenome TaxID=1076179 RepID=A0A645BFA7_9ZZZZ
MINKYVLPIPVRFIDNKVFSNKVVDINLTHSEDFLLNTNWNAFDMKYEYLPYMATPQEISYALACQNIAKGDCIDDSKTQLENIRKYYKLWNNYIPAMENNDDSLCEIKVKHIIDNSKKYHAISVETPATKQIKVAVGNARLSENDFIQALKNKPNRSYKRYQQVSKLLHEALEEEVDILVLPENFLPWEWLPDISRLCANNQMALITGVEHILSSKNGLEPQKVYNLTAVILPYVKDSFKFSHVVYHHKVHYSPLEKRKIQGYRMEPFPGDQYQLFQWKDLWFSVYCCFELASINDRSLFKSYADLTVAVEWNSDVIYFSNIIESLCRDLHCYCIQVNSSNYGDSRVISPSKTELRDIIKTKGGLNPTILVDEINIDDLRDFQRKEYELQKEDDRFKPTPPSFLTSVPEHKQNRTLWEHFDELTKIKEMSEID